MSLHDRLTEDLKLAMKARDQLRMDVIRMIKAAVMNKEMEIKKDLDDAEMSRVMTTMIKQRRESVEQFEKGNRAELAAKERQEITILESYLPQALSSEELSTVVDAVYSGNRRSISERDGRGDESRDGPRGRPAGRRQTDQRPRPCQAPIAQPASAILKDDRSPHLCARLTGTGMGILIVDDSPDQQTLLRSILKQGRPYGSPERRICQGGVLPCSTWTAKRRLLRST